MSRRRNDGPSRAKSYKRELGDATSRFLPHQGLPLLTDDGRVRWTSRMMAVAAILMSWDPGSMLLDRFASARAALVDMFPTRRRPGDSVEGLFRAMTIHGAAVLDVLGDHWRRCVREVAGKHWQTGGWTLFSVDGSKFDCPRTLANEKGFGVTGKNNSGPQQLVACLFHVASGILWGWRRDGIKGLGERSLLKQMLHLLPKGAMLLADAGFTGYELLKALMDQGNYFVIRVGANVKLIRKLGYAVIERKNTVYLWPLDKQGRNKRSMPKTLGKVRLPLVLRLITLKDAKGKPVVLLTNVLEKTKLRDHEAQRMYRLRWGIEVMWRGLKQTMGHHKLLCRTPDRAGAELDWAMAGLWMMQLLGGSRMAQSGKSPNCHSTAKTLRVLRGAASGRRRRRKTLNMELGLAAKDTYNRTGSKTARHFPKRRPQRPPGSPEARMASAIEKRLIKRLLAQPPPNLDAA
jgi:hypothetical protein